MEKAMCPSSPKSKLTIGWPMYFGPQVVKVKSAARSLDRCTVRSLQQFEKSRSARYSQFRKLWMVSVSPLISAQAVRSSSAFQGPSLDGSSRDHHARTSRNPAIRNQGAYPFAF